MTKNAYLPGLNTIRAYAAMCIVIAHISIYAHQPFVESLFIINAWNAVTLFFVLSGFLITHKLLVEKDATGTVNLRQFYMRRISRIWPLAYLILGLGILVLPVVQPIDKSGLVQIGTGDWLAMLLLSAHVPDAFHQLDYLAPLWSIGVEEWFYALWPAFLKKWAVFAVSIVVIVIYLGIGVFFIPAALKESEFLKRWQTLYSFMRFDCMAVGALAAWIFHYRPHLRIVVYRMDKLITVCILLIVALGLQPGASWDIATASIFALWLLNVATNPRTMWRFLEQPFLSYLGKVSYGIYLWHPMIILASAAVLRTLNIENSFLYYATAILATIAVSHLSYHYFESRFLQSKSVFVLASVGTES
ncbi:MAG: acyltransferase family protein [Chloroflexi bacterium]|nr:acyltransferase family protein [Chloroflexota bacterium]